MIGQIGEPSTVFGPVVIDGGYLITNVQYANAAHLSYHREGALVTAVDHNFAVPEGSAYWRLERLDNGMCTIKNVATDTYAGPSSGANPYDVVSHNDQVQWQLHEVSRNSGHYTIGITGPQADEKVYWGLQDAKQGTQIRLYSDTANKESWWKLTSVTSLL